MKRSGSNSDAFRAKVFKALGDPARLQIVAFLKDGGKYVNEIVKQLGTVQPAVSRHLKILKECGIVEENKVGNKRLYKVTDQRVLRVIYSLSPSLMNNLRRRVLEHMV